MPSTTARVVSVSLIEDATPEAVAVLVKGADGQTLTWRLPLAQAPNVGVNVTLTVTAA